MACRGARAEQKRGKHWPRQQKTGPEALPRRPVANLYVANSRTVARNCRTNGDSSTGFFRPCKLKRSPIGFRRYVLRHAWAARFNAAVWPHDHHRFARGQRLIDLHCEMKPLPGPSPIFPNHRRASASIAMEHRADSAPRRSSNARTPLRWMQSPTRVRKVLLGNLL